MPPVVVAMEVTRDLESGEEISWPELGPATGTNKPPRGRPSGVTLSF